MNNKPGSKVLSTVKHLFRIKIFTLILFLVILVIVFSIITKGRFIAPLNIRNVLQTISVIGLLAIGAGALMIAGYVDLSVGGIGTLCSMLCAVLITLGVPWWLGVLAAVVLGAIGGLVNVLLINKLNFQPFIATLALAQIGEGLSYLLCDSKPVQVTNTVLRSIGSGRLFTYIPYTAGIIMIAFVIYALLMNKTRFGRSIYLIGSNPEAARLSGLHPKKLLAILFVNSGVLAAISGIILMSRVGTATTTGITVSRFSGMTAAILGGISFGGGSGGMAGAFVGLLILGSFNNAMTLIGLDAYLQQTAAGLLLIFALVVDFFIVKHNNQLALKSAMAGAEGGDGK